MSAPGRRRNPTITRGKKSERKRNKRRGLQTDNVSPINGLAAISEKAEQERKAKLISNEITDADITLLSEPSNTFNTETNNISNIPTKKEQNLININATNFNSGIELDKTKNDRSRVIKGQKPIIFKTMPKELKEKKQEIRQASRQVDDDIIEKTRKRTEQEKKNAEQQALRDAGKFGSFNSFRDSLEGKKFLKTFKDKKTFKNERYYRFKNFNKNTTNYFSFCFGIIL